MSELLKYTTCVLCVRHTACLSSLSMPYVCVPDEYRMSVVLYYAACMWFCSIPYVCGLEEYRMSVVMKCTICQWS